MNTLYFEKISRFDRRGEPVTVSIPFARGSLPNPQSFVLYDGDAQLPCQRRSLGAWDDGSVKWLLVHFQADLPGNQDKTMRFAAHEKPPETMPDAPVRLVEEPLGITVDTGPLSFLVPREGFLPLREVRLEGKALWQETPLLGFTVRCDGQELSSAAGPMELAVEESGPLRAVILVKGKHRREDGGGYLELRGRVTAFAGKPYLEIEHQFLHTEEEEQLSLEELRLEFRPQATGSPRLALGEGFYRTAIKQSDEPLEMAITAETLLYQANEHFIDSFYGDFWASWRDDSAGLTLSIYQAHQNFPKALRAHPTGIACSLYPAAASPAVVLQGMAKTHRLQLHFHPPGTRPEDCSVRSLQFQLPDRPSLPRAWYRDNNPWLEDFFPEIPRRLMSFFNRLHDGRPQAMGMLHFGDAPDASYSDQGRGQGHNVWVNNEYDHPHCCALFYGLSGQRRALDACLATARHWLDVDLCHYHPDPLVSGGLKIHTRYHGTGRVTPSHEWLEGFLDYYFLTGRAEGLEAARSVAENILRHMARPEMQRPGETSVREGGWALRAMVGMALGTGEERWKREARRLMARFISWHDTFGTLLAPYTSHSMPRVPFMISLTVNSFARYLLLEDDARVKKLIVASVDDLLEHGLGPDGIAYYKELPSLRRTAPTPHFIEALTYAYRITGDRRYLEIATRHFAALIESPSEFAKGGKYQDTSGAVIAGVGRGRIFADKYISLLLWAGAAAPLGHLDWYEYPFAR